MSDRLINVAVFVSGNGTNLQAIMDARSDGTVSHGKIALVVSDKKDAYALSRAQNNGIDNYFVGGKGEIFERRAEELLTEYGIELIVLAGFLPILSENFCRKYQNRILNVHPSLIPKYCGKGYYGIKVHQAVIANKETVSGATVHYVNRIIDGGDVIIQKKVEVLPSDTPQTLQERIMREAEWIILPQAIESVCKQLLEKRYK